MCSSPATPIERLAAALDELADAEVPHLADEVLRAEVAGLVTAVNRLDALLAGRLTAFDRRGLAAADGFRTARAWLRGVARWSGLAASGVVNRGRVAGKVPAVTAAALAGELSAEHVTQVVKLADRAGVEVAAGADETLAQAGRGLDPKGLAAVCDRVRAYADPDGPDSDPDPDADFDRRQITVSRFDGMVLVRGQLDPEGGAAVMAALDALMTPPAPDDGRSTRQRRADALVDLARSALTSGGLPTVGGVRPQIGVLITPEALTGTAVAGGAAGTAVAGEAAGAVGAAPVGPGGTYLDWVGQIPAEVARRVACDADAHAVVVHPDTGLPLYLGRSRRLVPAWLRRALHARDRGCRWPGCHAPTAWTDAHHIRAWQQGGDTDIDNLVLLCRYHHHLLHEGHWRLEVDPATGMVRITRPDGRPYEIRPSPPWTAPTARGHPTGSA